MSTSGAKFSQQENAVGIQSLGLAVVRSFFSCPPEIDIELLTSSFKGVLPKEGRGAHSPFTWGLNTTPFDLVYIVYLRQLLHNS